MSEKKSLTAKKYLGQLEVIDTKINQKLDELATLKSGVMSTGGIDYSKDRVQTSPSDTIGNAVVRYVSLNEEINREIDAFADARHQIINEIHGLNINDYIHVLYKVYVQFLALKSVAHEMGKSYQYTRELHKKALTMFEERYKNLDYLT